MLGKCSPTRARDIRPGIDAARELSVDISSTDLFIERSGDRISPQLLIQKFASPPVGERCRRGIVVRAIVPGEGVTLTWIAVNGCVRLFCERRFDLGLR